MLQEDEPKAIKGFDTKKANEIKRLEQFKVKFTSERYLLVRL